MHMLKRNVYTSISLLEIRQYVVREETSGLNCAKIREFANIASTMIHLAKICLLFSAWKENIYHSLKD